MKLGVVALLVLAVGAALASARPRDEQTAQRSAYRVERVASGLSSPLHVAAPRNEPNRLYIVEQGGRIRVLENGQLREKPFLDIRTLVRSGNEQGLLSVAFHPNYARNRKFYVQYTDRNGDTRIVEFRSDGRTAIARTRRQLFFHDDPYGNHNGGLLAFGPDGLMYASMGDGGAGGDPENRAQNPRSLFGKLLRFNVNRAGAKPQIAALGLRNPWRFSWDRMTRDLYIGDVGQQAWEEINYLPAGRRGLINYGWDAYEGNARFENKRPSGGKLVFPIVVYKNGGEGCSVTGGFVYRGSKVPEAVGRYFYGDFCAGTIWSLKVVDGKATDERRESIRVSSLASFGEDAQGELYMASLDGSVFRLAP